MYAWVGRVWAAQARRDADTTLEDFSDAAWNAVFAEIGSDYLPYLDANAAAYRQGARRFDGRMGAYRFPKLPVVRYRVACREQLLKAWVALLPAQQQKVQQRLAGTGIADWLASAAAIPSGLDAEFEMPLAQRYPPARGWYGVKLLRGTPWDLPKPPL